MLYYNGFVHTLLKFPNTNIFIKAFIEQREYEENLFKTNLSQGVGKCKNTLQTLFCYNPVIFIVDEKAMIGNRNNRIPHPSPDTIRKRNTYKSRRHKNNITIVKPRGQLVPSRCPRSYLKYNEQIVKD